jgi:delta 1-pyrroline-5-carboxylate dehydrogenase
MWPNASSACCIAAPLDVLTRGLLVSADADRALDSVAELTANVFGPILHVVRYHDAEVDALVDAINARDSG